MTAEVYGQPPGLTRIGIGPDLIPCPARPPPGHLHPDFFAPPSVYWSPTNTVNSFPFLSLLYIPSPKPASPSHCDIPTCATSSQRHTPSSNGFMMAPSQLQSQSDTSPESNTTTSDQPHLKSFSCTICAQRKVKCDRLPGGCGNCTRARVPCVYKAPPPPRRRKKGARDLDTATRLRVYEEALRQLGVDPEQLVKHESVREGGRHEVSGINDFLKNRPLYKLGSAISPKVGILVTEEGKSRYLENDMWTDLQGEFRESKEFLDDSSEDDSPEDFTTLPPVSGMTDGAGLILGGLRPSVDLRALHPQPMQTFRLWQLYLDNINPLVRPFHAPTIGQVISDATYNLDDIPRNVETLLFAVYCITTESMSDGECLAMFGQSKDVARQRFRVGAQQAFIKASFLRTSDIMVLQAFTLFVVSVTGLLRYCSSIS